MEKIIQPISIQQYRHEKSLRIQEKWRQQQIDIFYRTGRPIFENIEYKFRYYNDLNLSTKNKTLFTKTNLYNKID